MRCEVCGAPVDKGEKRCERCEGNETFFTPRPSSPILSGGWDRRVVTDSDAGPQVEKYETPMTRAVTEMPGPIVRDQKLPLPKSDSEHPLMPSSIVLEGKYRLENELGRGSMGTVFLAEDSSLKRKVAVKFLMPELAESDECADRFRQEAVAMAAIRNDNVAQIFSFGEDRGTPYFVMEYLDGETVEQLIDSHNRRGFYIPVDDAVDIMIQSVSGVEALHLAGSIHRDLKPANIMLTAAPMRAVIMDFGLVRNVRVEDDLRTLAGTPAYIAPELVEGRPGANRSKLTDIYSLGATFYEITTGSIPFGGETWVEILQKHITEIPVFPSTRRPGIPEAIDDVIMRAMSKEPHERYQDCEEFLGDLLEIQAMPLPHDRRPSLAPDLGPSARSTPRRRSVSGRHRTQRSGSGPNPAFRSTPNSSRGKLLVADADPKFRSLVHETAKATVPGCRVHSAADGPMTLEMIESVKPNLLMLDLSLPEINGFELVATIRGDSLTKNLNIIVVTDRGGQREASVLKSMGVKIFLTKPIDSADLAEVLRPLLERPGSMSIPPQLP
jgi:serine/threonine protein kinase